jgi:ssDNA-binding Zn-finger/Zn-ribbon topoisomerase 1
MTLTLIVGDNCPKCNYIKTKFKKEIENKMLKVIDADSAEGMIEVLSAFYQEPYLSLPLLVDGTGWGIQCGAFNIFEAEIEKRIYKGD